MLYYDCEVLGEPSFYFGIELEEKAYKVCKCNDGYFISDHSNVIEPLSPVYDDENKLKDWFINDMSII